MNADDCTPSSPVSTWELLRAIGFKEDSTVISDPAPGLSFDFGDFKLSASRVVNRSFVPVVLLSGILAGERSLSEVSSEMPLEVGSAEQGLAWIAWCLDGAGGRTFEFASTPAWLVEGRRHCHLLPWERERAAYAARPHCYVRREWARLALQTLAKQLAAVGDDLVVTLAFDGSVLAIRCGGELSVMPAKGERWRRIYAIKAGALRRLPKRLMKDNVQFAIQDSTLTICGWRYAGVLPLSE